MTDTNRDVIWLCKPFSELNVDQLFDLLKLRQDIFILEQNCLYPDIDQKDRLCHHLLGYQGDELVAYLRIVPAGLSYQEPSFGRVAVVPSARSGGFGKMLVAQGIRELQFIYPGQVIQIGAQEYLRDFYSSFGFIEAGDIYDEDGIPHIDMLLSQ